MEKELLAALEHTGLDKSHLQKYSTLITHLRANKLVLEKWWVLGQPAPEILNVVGRISRDGAANLGGILGTKGLDRAKVFPKGIINPEFFDLHMEFNARHI